MFLTSFISGEIIVLHCSNRKVSVNKRSKCDSSAVSFGINFHLSKHCKIMIHVVVISVSRDAILQ